MYSDMLTWGLYWFRERERERERAHPNAYVAIWSSTRKV